jgi:outer membrane lipoprotein-sorting protein
LQGLQEGRKITGEERMGDVPTVVYEQSGDSPLKDYTMKWWYGKADGLIRKLAHYRDGQVTIQAIVRCVEINPMLKGDEFQFKVPPGLTVEEEPLNPGIPEPKKDPPKAGKN